MVHVAGSNKYVFFWLPDSAESKADGALEHANSYVVCCGGPTALSVNNYTAHEFFHLWNVKRIRPAELWPYDYSRPIDTPSLWLSEGITDYYGLLLSYRAGFMSDTALVQRLAALIAGNESNDERKYVSPSDASMSTWRAYLHEPVNYYDVGTVLGALLDVSILQDTRGSRGLGDVMRALYEQFYERNKGFTPSDLVRTVSAVAGQDYGDFFRRYVTGVEVPHYDSIFNYAGVRLARSPTTWGILGTLSTVVDHGRRLDTVAAGLPAAVAGLRKDDVLVAIDGVPVERVPFLNPNGCCIPISQTNALVVVTVLRGSTRLQVPLTLRRGQTTFSVEFDPGATPEQVAVRRAWLAKR
jgi:predicted metalloprotease with PDZ domain